MGLLVSFINDSLGLFLASREQAKFHNLDKRCESDPAFDLFRDPSGKVEEVHRTVCFHIETHGVASVPVGDADLVLAGGFREFLKDFLDLAREYINALDLDHIVGSSHDDIQTREFAAARAVSRDNA